MKMLRMEVTRNAVTGRSLWCVAVVPTYRERRYEVIAGRLQLAYVVYVAMRLKSTFLVAGKRIVKSYIVQERKS